MKVSVINKSKNELPAYATKNSAGLDLRAALNRLEFEQNDMKIKINMSWDTMPSYIDSSNGQTIIKQIIIAPGGRCLIPTGLFMKLPEGYEAQIRPRSGLALKHGITVLNSPGTIDADYRGEIKIILVNLSKEPFIIHEGDRIAQMVVAKHEVIDWEPVCTLENTERGNGGFNSTGIK